MGAPDLAIIKEPKEKPKRKRERIRKIEMTFDLSCEYDRLTYERLAIAAKRGGRTGRGQQARYFAKVFLGVIQHNNECAGWDLPSALCRKCYHDMVEEVKLEEARELIRSRTKPALQLVSKEPPPSLDPTTA